MAQFLHWPTHPAAAAEMTSGNAPGQSIPALPALPAAATTITPCRSAKSIAACIRGSGTGAPRLMLMTTGEPNRGPPGALSPAT